MKYIIIALFSFFAFSNNAWSLTTLKFKSKYDGRHVIDLGDSGTSIGDLTAGHGNVFAINGDVIGRFYVYTISTKESSSSEVKYVNAEYAFGDGLDTINIMGSGEYTPGGLAALNRPLYFAISGGTGKYSGARGVCEVARMNDGDHIVTCKFSAMRIKFK
jgi:hypothetical protein